MPIKNQEYFLSYIGFDLHNNPGNQKNAIHQYLSKLLNISEGKIQNIAATKNPTKPEKKLIH